MEIPLRLLVTTLRRPSGKRRVDHQEEGRFGLTALFQNIDESAVDERTARTAGSFYLALMSGLVVQWLVDSGRAPSGGDLAEALRTIVASVRVAEEADDKRQ